MAATARSVNEDPYQNHRFHIFDHGGLLSVNTPSGGFSSISVPEANIDMGEYREGLWVYSRKYPLRGHFTQVSLHKGVMKNDSAFFKIARATMEGKRYRTDISIKHFHRTDVSGKINYKDVNASREIRCYGCLPVRFRPGTDFDSMNSDISIEEIDFEVEYFRVFMNGSEVTV